MPANDSNGLTPDDLARLDALAKRTGKTREQILHEAFLFFAGCYNTFAEAQKTSAAAASPLPSSAAPAVAV